MKVRIEFEEGDESDFKVVEFSHAIDTYDRLSEAIHSILKVTNWRHGSVILQILETLHQCEEFDNEEVIGTFFVPQGTEACERVAESLLEHIAMMKEEDERQ